MLFTFLNTRRKAAPDFTARQRKARFIILAISEISLLALLLLLLVHFMPSFDLNLLLAGLVMAFGLLSLVVRKSSSHALLIFLFSLIGIELVLLSDLPPYSLNVLSWSFPSSAFLPLAFVLLDLAVAVWVMTHGLFIDTETPEEG